MKEKRSLEEAGGGFLHTQQLLFFRIRAAFHHAVRPNKISVHPSLYLDSFRPRSCMASPHACVHPVTVVACSPWLAYTEAEGLASSSLHPAHHYCTSLCA